MKSMYQPTISRKQQDGFAKVLRKVYGSVQTYELVAMFKSVADALDYISENATICTHLLAVGDTLVSITPDMLPLPSRVEDGLVELGENLIHDGVKWFELKDLSEVHGQAVKDLQNENEENSDDDPIPWGDISDLGGLGLVEGEGEGLGWYEVLDRHGERLYSCDDYGLACVFALGIRSVYKGLVSVVYLGDTLTQSSNKAGDDFMRGVVLRSYQ